MRVLLKESGTTPAYAGTRKNVGAVKNFPPKAMNNSPKGLVSSILGSKGILRSQYG